MQVEYVSTYTFTLPSIAENTYVAFISGFVRILVANALSAACFPPLSRVAWRGVCAGVRIFSVLACILPAHKRGICAGILRAACGNLYSWHTVAES